MKLCKLLYEVKPELGEKCDEVGLYMDMLASSMESGEIEPAVLAAFKIGSGLEYLKEKLSEQCSVMQGEEKRKCYNLLVDLLKVEAELM